MPNKKINQLVNKTTILSTDLFPIGDGTSGQLFKKTIAELQAAIGGAVISVNGLVGTVVLDTDDIQELASPTNKYFTDARARAALSATSPLAFNSSTGVFSMPAATTSANGYLTSTDWNTFNGKENVLTFSSPLVRTLNTISMPAATTSVNGYLSSTDWNTFNNKQGALTLTVTGSSGASTLIGNTLNVPTYTLAGLGGITASFLSGGTGITYNSGTGVIATTITQYTDALARASLSFTAGSGAYNSTTGVITIPTNTNQLTNGASFITLGSLSAGTGITYNSTTGAISYSGTVYTDASIRGLISLTTTGSSGASTYNSTTGVLNIPNYGSALSGYLPLTGGTLTGALGGTSATFSSSIDAASYIMAGWKIADWTGSIIKFGGINTSQWNQLDFYTNNAVRLSIANTGAATFSSSVTASTLNLNTTVSTGAKLIVNGYTDFWSATNTLLRVQHNGTIATLQSYTGGANGVIALNPEGGNILVGITTDSGYKLDVNGTGRFSGVANTMLTLDSSNTNGYTATQINYSGSAKALIGFGTYLTTDGGVAIRTATSTPFTIAIGGGTPTMTLATTGAATFSSSVSGTSIRSNGVGSFAFNTANNGEFQIYATALDGMVMAGKGSSNDMVITNKSGSDVFRIPTGTTTAHFIGSVGINTSSPQDKLTVKGAINYNLNLGLLGGYSAIYVYNDAGSSYKELRIDGSFLALQSYSGGNVLIGTTTDSGQKLQVSGTIAVNNRTILQSGAIVDNAINGNNVGIGFGSAGIIPTDGSGSYSAKNIGTSSLPWGNLFAGAATFSSSVTAGGDVTLSGNESYLYFSSTYTVGSNTRAKIRTVGAGGGSGYGGDLRFSTRTPSNTWNEDALIINSAGAATFSSSVTATTFSSVNSTPQMDFVFSVNTAYKHSIVASNFSSSPASSNILDFRVANGANSQVTVMNLTGAGSVGIGTSSPDARLTVIDEVRVKTASTSGVGLSKDGNGAYLYNIDNTFMAFGTNNTERMRITSAGGVSIGKTTNTFATSTRGSLEINGSTDSIMALYCNNTLGGYVFHGGSEMQILNNVTGGPLQFYTQGALRASITAGGNILLGTTTDNGERLYVSGNIRATGTITANSDIRLKKNLERIENALEKVGQISGYTYNTIYDDKRHGGVIAQEVDEVFPEIVNKGNDGLLGVEYGNISALLIEALKELKEKNTALEARLQALEK